MTKPPQTMASSDFNMEKLSTKELSEHIKGTIQIGGNICVFGRRGTGKTEISQQQILEAGMEQVYVNLSVYERVDIGGYPNMMGGAADKKYVDFLLPAIFKPMIEGDKKVVALLDEIDKADPSLWAPLLEIFQQRNINGRPLKNLHAIISTGNLISEGGSRPSLPLLDRSEKFLVEASAEAWLNWAGKSGGIHPAILAYLTDNPQDLYGAVDPEERYADRSPRGWTRASRILHAGEALKWNTEFLNKKVAGCVGKDAGLKYFNYYDHYQELLPMIEEVFNGGEISSRYHSLSPSKQMVACMITCARLATQLDACSEDNVPKSVEYVGNFFSFAGYENVLVAVRSQIQLNRIIKFNLDEHPNWKEMLALINKSVD